MDETMSFSSKRVANILIDFAIEDGEPLTRQKLIKLIYIAHGFSLSILNKPLINETIYAYQYGPTIKSIHNHFAEKGSDPIKKRIGFVNLERIKKIDDDLYEILLQVYQKYKHLSGVQLFAITKPKEGPWEKVVALNSHKDIKNNIFEYKTCFT